MECNRFIYHYCSHYQVSVGVMAYIDGIALMMNPVKCMDDYKELKNQSYQATPSRGSI